MRQLTKRIEGLAVAMFTYAAEVYGKKSIEPGEDLSTTIINASVDGERLDIIDFALFFMLLVDAGGDTTRNLVSGGMLELLRHDDQLTALRSDPDALLPNAIEEMLRFVTPVIYMCRTANADEHIAFGGGGPHFCLGADLARLEIDALLREMLARLPDLELAGATPYLGSNFISGPTAMPVRFSPGPRSEVSS